MLNKNVDITKKGQACLSPTTKTNHFFTPTLLCFLLLKHQQLVQLSRSDLFS